MKSLIEKISDAGIKTSPDKDLADITVTPEYRGNCGFYHVKGNGWELAFVKGVYKDNIKRLNGECPLKPYFLNEISQKCADIERALRTTVTVKLFMQDDKPFFTEAETYTCRRRSSDMRDPDISEPLTPVERSLAKNEYVNDKYLFIRNPFADIMPETLSPVTMSLAAAIPDVLNPLFMSCNIKTSSPSVKVMFGRMYMNSANAETIIPAFYSKIDFFLLNFAPALFRKIKKPSFELPDDSDIRISDEEITTAADDIRKSIEEITTEDILSDDMNELAALCAMTWEMAYLRLWKHFTSLHKYIGKSIEDTLLHIYRTRGDTILNQSFEGLSTQFDPACLPKDVKGCGIEHLTPEEMYKTLPASRRLTLSRAKYTEKLALMHRYLRMRDDIYLSVSGLVSKVRELLLEAGKEMVENSMITNAEDIFLFELKEIKNILNDEYHGNIPFTLNFRRWQSARFAALCTPFYLYEKDSERAEELARAQMKKYTSEGSIPCSAFFHKELTTDSFAVSLGYDLASVRSVKDKDIVIAEAASLFSYITEYCAATEKPLYSGARFAALLLKDRTVTTSDKSVSFR